MGGHRADHVGLGLTTMARRSLPAKSQTLRCEPKANRFWSWCGYAVRVGRHQIGRPEPDGHAAQAASSGNIRW